MVLAITVSLPPTAGDLEGPEIPTSQKDAIKNLVNWMWLKSHSLASFMQHEITQQLHKCNYLTRLHGEIFSKVHRITGVLITALLHGLHFQPEQHPRDSHKVKHLVTVCIFESNYNPDPKAGCCKLEFP